MHKVEKVLKGSLDLIPPPSPSVKIQIMSGKVCLRCKGKRLLVVVNKLLKTICLLTSPSNMLSSQVNLPVDNLYFHWRWRWKDRIQAIFLNLFYFTINLYNSWTETTVRHVPKLKKFLVKMQLHKGSSSYILRRPQNFVKYSPYFWLYVL